MDERSRVVLLGLTKKQLRAKCSQLGIERVGSLRKAELVQCILEKKNEGDASDGGSEFRGGQSDEASPVMSEHVGRFPYHRDWELKIRSQELELEILRMRAEERSGGEQSMSRSGLCSNEGSQGSRGDVRRFVKLLPPLGEKTDIETYLATFETICQINQIPPELQACVLASVLTGIALEAYSELPVVEASNYEAVKTALLARYHLNAEAYRIKFRSTSRSPDELCTEWTDRKSVV